AHLPVERFVAPETFAAFEREALAMGFMHAACGPMVRSSYWADRQAEAAGVVTRDGASLPAQARVAESPPSHAG
ncbi:MAG: hypothetical protein WHS85_10120, partial [Hydrogenophilus sp.]